ncbi:56kDa selenium binding family protein [Mycobacterium xenopi 4042]|uniref:56kDa selenium binding family protein n=1 Tax=Mycobacterium xenopi 4042 TaxID=1299334 RepID=X8DLZ6_MYCXE|nr:56kDa selenium binding family protein [Mycobacterium xenopi 4042]
MVGWAELPSAGNELHHFGWNACSSALCHDGHAATTNWSDVISSFRHSLVAHLRARHQTRPTAPTLTHTIDADELAARPGIRAAHGALRPGGIFMSALGGADGNDGRAASR